MSNTDINYIYDIDYDNNSIPNSLTIIQNEANNSKFSGIKCESAGIIRLCHINNSKSNSDNQNKQSPIQKVGMYGDENYYLFECDENKISVNFVGFLYLGDQVIISLPKIFAPISNSSDDKGKQDDKREQSEYSDLIKNLFFKYHDKLRIRDTLYAGCTNESDYNKISIARKLGLLYIKRGLYSKAQSTFSMTHGRCHWGRTVARICPDIIDEVPFYRRCLRRSVHGEHTEISSVQHSVLYHLFKENSLERVFPFTIDIDAPELRFQHILDNKGYYINLLKNEIACIFDDDFIEVFENIIWYLGNTYEESKDSSFEIYGVMNFEYVFELMLGDLFGNQLEQKLANENGKNKLIVSYEDEVNTISDINRPIRYHWNWADDRDAFEGDNNYGILIPDIVVSKSDADSSKSLAIIDAKYYAPRFYPNSHDINKQILYQHLFKDILKLQFSIFFNSFFISLSKVSFNKQNNILFIGLGHVQHHESPVIDVVGVNVDLLMRLSMKDINISDNKETLFGFLSALKKQEDINSTNTGDGKYDCICVKVDSVNDKLSFNRDEYKLGSQSLDSKHIPLVSLNDNAIHQKSA